MKTFTAKEIASITNGTLLCGEGSTVITNIQYDSRAVTDGSLFVPIRGEKVDAHKFIEQCMENGAATFTEYDAPEGAERPFIKVDNTIAALQRLAAAYRAGFPDLKLIGVTGSVGKTSTKEMIAAALSKGFDVMKTSGNKNSQIGMPSTMFDIEDGHEAAVIEMGVSMFGEMDRLCDVARPEYAVMTNIGVAHIENLKTRENIMSEKLKITKHFDKNGILFLNGDDALLRTLYGKQAFRTVSFGMSADNDYHAENVQTEGLCTSFDCCSGGRSVRYTIPALGVHSVTNALAAIAVGEALGLDSSQIAKGLLTYKNAPMRQQIIQHDGFTVIDDSYNSSPDAAKVSVDVLSELSGGNDSIAVLADMLELGEKSAGSHYEVGLHLGKKGIKKLIAIGSESRKTAEGAKDGGCGEVYTCDSNDQAYELLKTLITKDCVILVKGSRGMHTDEIVKKL